MSVYVSDLPQQDRTYRELPNGGGVVVGPPVFLYCPRCGERSSASRGDYFMLDPDTKLRCGEHRPMVDLKLMREHLVLEEVDPKDLP